MNLQTILTCAQSTARQQLAAFGCVNPDVEALISEVESLLAPAPVEEPPEVAQVEAQAEAAFMNDVPHEQYTHEGDN